MVLNNPTIFSSHLGAWNGIESMEDTTNLFSKRFTKHEYTFEDFLYV